MHRAGRLLIPILIVAIIAGWWVVDCPQLPAQEPPVSAAAIQRAIDRARDYLVRSQAGNGTWDCAMRTDETRVGATALVALALANAGMGTEDPVMRRSLDWLRSQTPDDTYSVSLQTILLAMVSPDADRGLLVRNVEWLERAQITQGRGTGAWSYHLAGGSGDNSNAQFAVLALHEAARVGVPVKTVVWDRAQRYWTACQNENGSWGYTAGASAGTGSMTCAGIASIWITAEQTGSPDATISDDRISCCHGGSSPKPLERGLAWLGKNFTVTQNPGTGGQTWRYYYLYGLERVGRFTARRFIGQPDKQFDWYLEGAKMFVATQDQLTGAFRTGMATEDPTVATAFALLFLAKGRRPVIVAKSRHGPRDDWNQHGHEIAHLVEHVESRWKQDYPAGLSWHVIDTPSAQEADFAQAPVLWLSGKKSLELGPDAGRRLRRAIDQGGFIFAETACPEGREFDDQFRQLVTEIFPEPEYQLHLLPPEHPAWNAEEIVPAEFQRPLLGVDYGCRTCLIYAPPPAAGQPILPSLGCLWELGGSSRGRHPDNVRREIDAALSIGANVLAYATNRELKNKADLFAAGKVPDTPREDFVRGQLAIGKLRHGGQCDAAPAALANILRAAARELAVRVDDTPSQIDPASDALFDYHMVFMHGRQGFTFAANERQTLREFFDRGGMLLADSICASGAFTDAFRKEMVSLFPDGRLEPIPPEDPLFAAADFGGYDIREVTLREPAGGDGPLAARKRRLPPKLEGVRLADRWAVIFSPYDLSCALEKQNSMECTGYDREDAERIALNVLLYSLNQ